MLTNITKKIFNQSKRRNGFSLPEILVACAIIISLSSAAFFGFNQAQHTRKMAQMNSDMEAISTACLAYEALSMDSTLPASLAALATGLAAEDSIDGVAHSNFLTSSKSNQGDGANLSIQDPWGNAYTYDQTNRTITCTPHDPGGNPMTAVVRRF